MFRTYVEKVLALTLAAGDVVVMDDLLTHKAAGYDPDKPDAL